MSAPLFVKIKSETDLVPNGTSSHGKSNGKVLLKTEVAASSRKQRRKEWWDKQNKSSENKSNEAVKSHVDSQWVVDENGGQQEIKEEHEPNDNHTSTQQRSKLRNRNTIAKPDSLKYEHDYNRGFHSKIMQNLFTEAPKKKKKRNDRKAPVEAQKRKSSSTTGMEPEGNKKPKAAEESEIVDLYKFSLNLINGEVDTSKTTTSKDSKNKYVLFIGNLPYDITREQLEEHFRKTGGIKSIRIPRDKITDKGRGFAYMEFDGRISHGIALRLHHTTLGGRKINVEFTSIGGGKSEARKAKLQRKNSKIRKLKY